ncbi:MAG: acylphosphatase [Candidatus Methanoperedens sp.]|nr:acylphosphatase [Candidatus Methanoperedens sp.]
MKLEITITGKKVHDIGYRHFLLTHALMRGIDRLFTYNSYIQDKQAVILLVEGEDADVADMLDFVKTNFPKDAEGVEDIKSKVHEGKIMDIYQFMHLAQVEQLDKGIPAIIEMKGDVKEMKGDVKEILVKQDETIQEIKKLRFDLKSYLDTRFEEVFSEIGKIKEKIGLS